jgi:hypothetical protein
MRSQFESIGVVVVSDAFMHRWPYLIDSSVVLDIERGGHDGNVSMSEICQTGNLHGPPNENPAYHQAVWALRGWSKASDSKSQSSLKRSDGKSTPKWLEVKHRQDGKYRLGYNPATDSKDIHQEDLDAVKARRKGQGKSKAFFGREGGDRAVLERQQNMMAKL